MGPRSDERGNMVRWGAIQPTVLLQWGRVRMNAEIGGFVAIATERSSLQWGRVRMNAEISPDRVGQMDQI